MVNFINFFSQICVTLLSVTQNFSEKSTEPVLNKENTNFQSQITWVAGRSNSFMTKKNLFFLTYDPSQLIKKTVEKFDFATETIPFNHNF